MSSQANTNAFMPDKTGNKDSKIKLVVPVLSGKGGVGKSLVTSLLAIGMRRKGYEVGILDADLTGPSIPKAFGLDHMRAVGTEDGMLPVKTLSGIQVQSLNLLLEDNQDPVVWRGPMLTQAIQQFWQETVWGDIDILFIDMPPGTADVALTVAHSFPVDGLIMVTTPQQLVEMIVGKGIRMAEMLQTPVWGLVENMSYFECPTCETKHEIFGESRVEELAEKWNIPSHARMPIVPGLSEIVDEGRLEQLAYEPAEPILAYIEEQLKAKQA